MPVTPGQVAGAHLARIKADCMVLVTCGAQEKPGGLRCTDGLVRWRGVWGEQKLWSVRRERQDGEVFSQVSCQGG